MTVWGFLDPMYWSSLNSVWILLNGVEIKFRSQETNILNLIASVSVPQYVTSDSILRTKISAGTTQGCENWISLSVIQKEICSLTLFPILTFFIRPRPVHRSGVYYGKACSVTQSLRYVPSPLITRKVTDRFPPFLVCESVMGAPTRPCSYFWPNPPLGGGGGGGQK